MTQVHRPGELDEATEMLAALGPSAQPVAGGTDVVLDRRLGRIAPTHLVDLSPLPQLAGIDEHSQTVRIGAMARLAEVQARLRASLPAVAEAARGVGTPLVRGMATMGGNLCRAASHGELAPALLVHDAVLSVAGPATTRTLAVGELATEPDRTSLGDDEILTAVELPVAAGWGGCYLPFDPAGVGVAVALEVAEGAVVAARVALCWVVPVAGRVPAAEEALVGPSPPGPGLDEAVAAVRAACDPPADPVRGPDHHRRHVAGVLLRRAVDIAHVRATGRWPAGRLAPPAGRSERRNTGGGG